MNNKSDVPGPTRDQVERVSLLARSQFIDLLDILHLGRQKYSTSAPPLDLAQQFADDCRSSMIMPLTIEVAVNRVANAQWAHTLKALDLLALPVPVSSPPSDEDIEKIAAKGEVNGVTLAMFKAAIFEAKKNMGSSGGSLPENEPDWQEEDTAALEQIMGGENTLLPIHFIKRACSMSNAVGKVILEDQSSGTGFVISGNLLVTNSHVLPDKQTARTARVLFNFQQDEQGRDMAPITIELDPDATFLNSPTTKDDLTIVALKESANGRWAEVSVSDVPLQVKERVCIIQHPGGQQKHIGLYHNIVTYVDQNLTHYLTDTLPGSSGSPVFNADWKLVAVHHRGGSIREPATKRWVFRNEGILVGRLIALLASQQTK